ncbi:hypothetical protein NW762_003084 [Fusarium torreyae]|uniref:Uncharacterized protein n=1 Tax=Fusarium torreyae TaxID=1237075 RepID=A0A9W8S9C3_9HYPO|nr:hypothetical protein NW762_003084 [Fusarium torreyae]
MSRPKLLSATESTQQLCAQQRDKELQKERGPLREYRPSMIDAEILRQFEREHAPSIRRNALDEGQVVGEARNYGPRELAKGTIASPERTITVFIPLATQTTNFQRLPIVLYQPNKDKAELRELIPWRIDTHIQIPGNSRIVVEEGPVCFDMVQYDWETGKDQHVKGQ